MHKWLAQWLTVHQSSATLQGPQSQTCGHYALLLFLKARMHGVSPSKSSWQTSCLTIWTLFNCFTCPCRNGTELAGHAAPAKDGGEIEFQRAIQIG